MENPIFPYDEEKLKKNREINFGRPYQQCKLSVMDTIADPDITFDENGISNYYYEFQNKLAVHVLTGVDGERKLQEITNKIKSESKGQKYDCITGVSGGVDSTYVCYLAKKLGLNPLIVHFDNGWNSQTANQNIQNIISKLGFDLYTLVVEWDEFKDLQLSYLKASVVDIEAITDHAIITTMYKLAKKHNIKYILSGSNIVTEATLPKSWIWNKGDHVNILDIHKKFGTLPLKTFPLFNTILKKYYKAKGIETITPLNYIDYNKEKVKEVITTELGWQDYGGKHYESIWTRFYQGYILPTKFRIDKRKAHLSDLIFSKQISKETALDELKLPIYDEQQFRQDYDFVLKKLNLSEQEFDQIMKLPVRKHQDFKTEKSIWAQYPILSPVRPLWRVVKKTLHV